MANDIQTENFLDAITSAILAELPAEQLDVLANEHRMPRAEAQSLVQLVNRLHQTLDVVRPNKAYAERIKRELYAQYDPSLMGRLRRLPARVQLATLLVFLGGFLFISRRRQEATMKEVLI